MDLFDLTGKIAIVTGGTRGLGNAIAKGLAMAGANLAVIDRNFDESTISEIEAVGVKCQGFQFDLNDFGKYDKLIAPGYMDTEMNTALKNDETRCKQIVDRIPANRWGNPQDLVGATIFLSSSVSDYVHGCTIAVDGGWLGR